MPRQKGGGVSRYPAGQRNAFFGTLCGGSNGLGRIYAGGIFRLDDDKPMVLLTSLQFGIYAAEHGNHTACLCCIASTDGEIPAGRGSDLKRHGNDFLCLFA